MKYPTDSGLASAGVLMLAREERKLAKLEGEQRRRVGDRSRSMGGKLRAISRTIRRRPRGGLGGGAQAGQGDGRVVGALGQGGAKAGGTRAAPGSWTRREGEARGDGGDGGDGRSLREGRQADPPSWGTRARTRCCRARWPSSSASGSPRGRSRSTVGSCPPPPTARSRTFSPGKCPSLAAKNRPPSAPADDCPATERARRAASVTSNAATDWTDPA